MNKKDFFNVLFISLFSRIFYISLSFVSSLSISSYDKSTGLISNSKLNFLLRWDAICFYEIATNGYTSEHLLAFFPLFPYLISILGKNALIIGVLLSNIFFIFSSQLLFYLSKKRYSNKISYLTLLLFSFSPCSIIYCTLYSESLFTFLFFILFLILEEKNNFIKNKNTFKVKRNNLKLFISLLIGLICLVRSNGILFFIFCVFYLNIFYILIASMPLIFFQTYSFLKMQRSDLFIPYGFIQKNYWDQGFLRFYFDKKNIPNVIVSIPFLGFGLYLIVCYFVTIKGKLGKKEELRDVNNRLLMLIFTIQTVMSLFFIHSQIFFRFVSFNPLVYWSLALMIEEKGFRKMSLVLTGYFSYSIAYAILFGAYYPPA